MQRHTHVRTQAITRMHGKPGSHSVQEHERAEAHTQTHTVISVKL